MPRARQYKDNAARQAAYRARKAAARLTPPPAPPARPGAALVARVQAADEALRARDA